MTDTLEWNSNDHGKVEGNKLISTPTSKYSSAVFTSTLPISRFSPSTNGLHFTSLTVGKEIALGVGPLNAKTNAEIFYANTHTGAVRFEGCEENDTVKEVESEGQKMQLLVNQETGGFEYIIDGTSHKF